MKAADGRTEGVKISHFPVVMCLLQLTSPRPAFTNMLGLYVQTQTSGNVTPVRAETQSGSCVRAVWTHAADFTHNCCQGGCTRNEGPFNPRWDSPPTHQPFLSWRVFRKFHFPWNRSQRWVLILFVFTAVDWESELWALITKTTTNSTLFFIKHGFLTKKKKRRHVGRTIVCTGVEVKTNLNMSPSLLSLTSRLDQICVRLFCLFGAVHGSDPRLHYQHTRIKLQLLRHFTPKQASYFTSCEGHHWVSGRLVRSRFWTVEQLEKICIDTFLLSWLTTTAKF